MKRIIFTGAQGTGKTTALSFFKNQGMYVITEVVRQLAKQGFPINQAGTDETQKAVFKKYSELLSQEIDYISDRGLIDVLAYTKYLMEAGKIKPDIFKDQYEKTKQFFEENWDIVVCYFPIEFPVVDDGVRDTDENFRQQIDKNILDILLSLKIEFMVIKGTVEQRKAHLQTLYNIMPSI